MKKLFGIGMIMLLLAITASAQGPGDRLRKHSMREGIRSGQLTRLETMELRKNNFRYNNLQRRAHRDGVITPYERRKLHKTKVHNRREAFRYKHNRRHRLI